MNTVDFLFEKSSELKKDFVVGVKEKITYSELYSFVHNLALDIVNQYGFGENIVLLSENNLFFIVSYLSIIKSGNRVVLVDTDISKNDLYSIITLCSPTAFFIQDKYSEKYTDIKNIFTEKYLDKIKLKTNFDTEKEVAWQKKDDDDTAVIIFTSGSTGDKKGVMLTHKNIQTNTDSILSYLKLTKDDRMIVVLPFFYCYGLSLLHTHLRIGGSIVLHQSPFLGSVIKEIKEYSCTGFAGVPTTFQILINKTNFLEQHFPHLRYMTQAGGKLVDTCIDMITASFPSQLFFIMYGATEATARLSYLPPHMIKKKRGSIGKGILGVTLKVVDKNGVSVGPNIVGEIIATGDNIMKGYYKDTKGTSYILKNKWYYTGDLATIDREGYIYITGRAKNIIKSAGHRISPNEIEDIINKIKGVSNSVAVGMKHEILGESVVVLVETPRSSKELTENINSYCKKHLSSHKVPSEIFFTKKLPLTSSNKIDKEKVKNIILKKMISIESV